MMSDDILDEDEAFVVPSWTEPLKTETPAAKAPHAKNAQVEDDSKKPAKPPAKRGRKPKTAKPTDVDLQAELARLRGENELLEARCHKLKDVLVGLVEDL